MYILLKVGCVCVWVRQVVCGQNCTFLVQSSGAVLAVGEGSYGRLGQGNSDDLYTPTLISALQGTTHTHTHPSYTNTLYA